MISRRQVIEPIIGNINKNKIGKLQKGKDDMPLFGGQDKVEEIKSV